MNLPETTDDDRRECATIILRGATIRLLMVLDAKSEHNYEYAVDAVESAIKKYREASP